jgi:hypothetical protein
MRRLQAISKDLSEVELKDAIIEQKRLLVDAKEEILRLREENTQLREETRALESRRDFAKDLITVSGFKYDAKDGAPVGLPYCPKCEVAEGKFFKLGRRNKQYSRCPNCGVIHNAAHDGRVNLDTPPPKEIGSF